MKARSNQSGFSLVELMIAAAVLSILALAFSGYMQNINIQQRNAQENMDMMVLNNQLNAAAMDAQSIKTSGEASITVTTTSTPEPWPDDLPPGTRYPNWRDSLYE